MINFRWSIGNNMGMWIILAFLLGFLDLLGSQFNLNDPFFMQLNGYIFLLIGMGLFIRLHYHKREARIEKLEERVQMLEAGAQQ